MEEISVGVVSGVCGGSCSEKRQGGEIRFK